MLRSSGLASPDLLFFIVRPMSYANALKLTGIETFLEQATLSKLFASHRLLILNHFLYFVCNI